MLGQSFVDINNIVRACKKLFSTASVIDTDEIKSISVIYKNIQLFTIVVLNILLNNLCLL